MRKGTGSFDAQAFLRLAGPSTKVVEYRRAEDIFSQGDRAESVVYIQKGGVKLSVLSKTGREAVVAMLGPGDFFGEGCLAAQPIRIGSATAITPSSVLVIKKNRMVKVLHEQHALSDLFIAHMLLRNVGTEQDLIGQLFNSSEKRLAQALLLLARYGKQDKPRLVVPKLSHDTLAEMTGTKLSRVDFFMNKFKKLGFINTEDGLKINSSLLSVVLHAGGKQPGGSSSPEFAWGCWSRWVWAGSGVRQAGGPGNARFKRLSCGATCSKRGAWSSPPEWISTMSTSAMRADICRTPRGYSATRPSDSRPAAERKLPSGWIRRWRG